MVRISIDHLKKLKMDEIDLHSPVLHSKIIDFCSDLDEDKFPEAVAFKEKSNSNLAALGTIYKKLSKTRKKQLKEKLADMEMIINATAQLVHSSSHSNPNRNPSASETRPRSFRTRIIETTARAGNFLKKQLDVSRLLQFAKDDERHAKQFRNAGDFETASQYFSSAARRTKVAYGLTGKEKHKSECNRLLDEAIDCLGRQKVKRPSNIASLYIEKGDYAGAALVYEEFAALAEPYSHEERLRLWDATQHYTLAAEQPGISESDRKRYDLKAADLLFRSAFQITHSRDEHYISLFDPTVIHEKSIKDAAVHYARAGHFEKAAFCYIRLGTLDISDPRVIGAVFSILENGLEKPPINFTLASDFSFSGSTIATVDMAYVESLSRRLAWGFDIIDGHLTPEQISSWRNLSMVADKVTRLMTSEYLGPELKAKLSKFPPFIIPQTKKPTERYQNEDHLVGFMVNRTNVVTVFKISSFAMAHEFLHYASALGGGNTFVRWKDETGNATVKNTPKWFNEGLTELHTLQLCNESGARPDYVSGYALETAISIYFQKIVGADVLKKAYLSGNFTEVRRIIDTSLGKGSFDKFLGSRDTHEATEVFVNVQANANIPLGQPFIMELENLLGARF